MLVEAIDQRAEFIVGVLVRADRELPAFGHIACDLRQIVHRTGDHALQVDREHVGHQHRQQQPERHEPGGARQQPETCDNSASPCRVPT